MHHHYHHRLLLHCGIRIEQTVCMRLLSRVLSSRQHQPHASAGRLLQRAHGHRRGRADAVGSAQHDDQRAAALRAGLLLRERRQVPVSAGHFRLAVWDELECLWWSVRCRILLSVVSASAECCARRHALAFKASHECGGV